jgi:hypothetical protein
MGTRTLVEFNHDYLSRLRDRPDIMACILYEIATSFHMCALNAANQDSQALDIGHGVRIILQRWHDTETVVKTEFAEVRL